MFCGRDLLGEAAQSSVGGGVGLRAKGLDADPALPLAGCSLPQLITPTLLQCSGKGNFVKVGAEVLLTEPWRSLG